MAPLTANTKAASHALRLHHTVEVIASDLTTLTNVTRVVEPAVVALPDAPPF